MQEIENHYYICLSCGFFYKIINGIRIRQDKTNLKFVTDSNFHIAKKHKCEKILEGVMHETKKKTKKFKRNGLYTIKERKGKKYKKNIMC